MGTMGEVPKDELVNQLLEYADIADAGDKPHWARAMRLAVERLQQPIKYAMKRNGASWDDLSVCGECDGTGWR